MSFGWQRVNLAACRSRLLTNEFLDASNNLGRRFCRHRAKFKTIQGAVDVKSSHYQKNFAANVKVIATFQAVLSRATAGGDARAIDRHVKTNKKILVKDRLALLFDNMDDVLELSPLAGMGMSYGDVPRGGLICAIGKVSGVYCMLVANDATVKAGTMYPISVKKQVHAGEIAIQNGLPCIYVVDSGGAFLPMQDEIFPDRLQGGRTFYNEAILNGLDIPQLAVVCGSCTAGAAYVPTMAQEAVIVDKVGTIFLGGPPLVRAALGEIVSPDELGGARLHCNISGCTDYFAETEQQAFELTRASVCAFNIASVVPQHDVVEPAYDAQELLGIISADDNTDIDMHKVIARIVDGSAFHEFKASYGRTMITGFCHINGYLVGLVANNGLITSEAALKASHFVQLCSQRDLPLIFLQNIFSSEPDVFSAQQVVNGSRLRNHAKLLSSVACADVPIITVVVGNSYGVESYMMGGKSLNARFLFCWPNARICITEPQRLAESLLMNEIEKSAEPLGDDKIKELRKSLLEKCLLQSSALYSSSQAWDDGVILPQDTRKVVGQCLNIVHQNAKFRHRAADKAVIRM